MKSGQLFYPRRTNDFRKIPTAANPAKSFVKDFALFKPAPAPVFGGSHIHTFQKENSSAKKKIYYKSRHKAGEYPAFEIFNYLGIYTPKCRFVVKDSNTFHMVKGVTNYIPMSVVLEKYVDPDWNVHLGDNTKYKLDISAQLIIDKTNNKKYKISGNLFVVDMAALLVADNDFWPDGLNLGVVKNQNRFYAAAIDKDWAKFTGKTYGELALLMGDTINIELFASRTTDQELIIVSKVVAGLEIDNNGECDFDRIFNNSRVKATPNLDPILEDNKYLKKSLHSFLDHYTNKYGNDFLIRFSEREQIRAQIAEHIIQMEPYASSDLDLKDLKQIIVEDLRAPYYVKHFADKNNHQIGTEDLNNEDLKNTIMKDLNEEFSLELRQKSFKRPR